MKRINITYGGVEYTLANRDPDELKTTLVGVYESGTPIWLRVNIGEGSYQETDLLIAPGMSLAVTGIDAD